MVTITIKRFTNEFLSISERLTFSEVRMLYLLIVEPKIRFLSQQEIAEKIGANRRTVNIGLKKLKELGYIIETSYIPSVPDENIKVLYQSIFDDLPKKEINRIKSYIIHAFIDYYQPSENKDIVVREDYYSCVLRDWMFNKKLKNKKEFITNTIRESHPNIKFYFELDKSFYKSEEWYIISQKINNEIINARNSSMLKAYHIKKEKLFDFLKDNYSIDDNAVLKVIKKDFPHLQIFKNRIKIPSLSEVILKKLENK